MEDIQAYYNIYVYIIYIYTCIYTYYSKIIFPYLLTRYLYRCTVLTKSLMLTCTLGISYDLTCCWLKIMYSLIFFWKASIPSVMVKGFPLSNMHSIIFPIYVNVYVNLYMGSNRRGKARARARKYLTYIGRNIRSSESVLLIERHTLMHYRMR
jgi:hypothetical protein